MRHELCIVFSFMFYILDKSIKVVSLVISKFLSTTVWTRQNIVKNLQKSLVHVNVHESTIRGVLNNNDVQGRVAKRKPL